MKLIKTTKHLKIHSKTFKTVLYWSCFLKKYFFKLNNFLKSLLVLNYIFKTIINENIPHTHIWLPNELRRYC